MFLQKKIENIALGSQRNSKLIFNAEQVLNRQEMLLDDIFLIHNCPI